MYRLERTDFVKSPYLSLWATLGFQAGFINAFGFLAFGRYVSHVTGFGTQIGVALGNQKPWFALELLGFPLSFILGSFFSGYFTIAKIERGEKPRYDLITLLLPLILITLLFFCELGVFGVFGEQLISQRDFALLFLLSFVCGMQNGCFATMTKGQIRTTHLTGVSTDIGTDLARLWAGKISGEERTLTQRTNLSRIVTFSFFALGSIVSVIVSKRFDFWALLIPSLTSLFVFFAVRRIGRMLDYRFRNEVLLRKRDVISAV
jgi:uncharacterized membrane protein YoaK (UPF0700 family)